MNNIPVDDWELLFVDIVTLARQLHAMSEYGDDTFHLHNREAYALALQTFFEMGPNFHDEVVWVRGIDATNLGIPEMTFPSLPNSMVNFDKEVRTLSEWVAKRLNK